jgi:putative acetyltransferase
MYIRRVRSSESDALIDIWLRSVRATHSFLTEADIQTLLPLVRDYVMSNASLSVLCASTDEPIGFMGLSRNSIDSLFIAPEWTGRGGGRALIEHARSKLRCRLAVDVNEQNIGAIEFYKVSGFEVVGRSAVDDAGRPFPLLHMMESEGSER